MLTGFFELGNTVKCLKGQAKFDRHFRRTLFCGVMAPYLTKNVICCCFRAITATNVNLFFSNLVTRLNALRARPSSIVIFGGVMVPYLTKNVVCCCFRAITTTNMNRFFFKLGNKVKCLNRQAKFDRHFRRTLFLQYFLQAGDTNFINLLVFTVSAPCIPTLD